MAQVQIFESEEGCTASRFALLLERTLTPFIGSPTLNLQLQVSALAQLHARWPLVGLSMRRITTLPRLIAVGRQ